MGELIIYDPYGMLIKIAKDIARAQNPNPQALAEKEARL